MNQKSLYNDEKELIFEKDNLLLNKALQSNIDNY